MIDKTETSIRKGHVAARLLADENINEVLSELGQEWLFESYKAATLEAREDARNNLRALDRVKEKLELIVSNGREAERELERNK
jgi:N-methylhydantoinase B/oxoprolinase/acetone carboxylase alpha subunit